MPSRAPSRSRFLLWGLLLLLGLVAATAFAGDLKNQWRTILDREAQAAVAGAPASVRGGDSMAKARYAFTAYCKALKGAGVNSNLFTRNAARMAGDEYALTCSWHNEHLRTWFQRFGIPAKDVAAVVADADSALPGPNMNHGALAVRGADGKACFFDPWQMAVANVLVGTLQSASAYEGAATSKWNGMPAEAWEKEMLAQGYTRFGDEAESGFWAPHAATVLNKVLGPFSPAPTVGGGGHWRFLEVRRVPYAPARTPATLTADFQAEGGLGGGTMRGRLVTDNRNGEGPSTWAGTCTWTWKATGPGGTARALEVIAPGDTVEASMTLQDASEPEKVSGWNHGTTGVTGNVRFDRPYGTPGGVHRAAVDVLNVRAGWKQAATQAGKATVPKGPGDPDWGGKMALVANSGFGRVELVYTWVPAGGR